MAELHTVQLGMAQLSQVQLGTTESRASMYSTANYSAAGYSALKYGTAGYRTAKYGTVVYGDTCTAELGAMQLSGALLHMADLSTRQLRLLRLNTAHLLVVPRSEQKDKVG